MAPHPLLTLLLVFTLLHVVNSPLPIRMEKVSSGRDTEEERTERIYIQKGDVTQCGDEFISPLTLVVFSRSLCADSAIFNSPEDFLAFICRFSFFPVPPIQGELGHSPDPALDSPPRSSPRDPAMTERHKGFPR